MQFEQTMLTILAGVVAYSLLSRRLSGSIITLPMVFTALGYSLTLQVNAQADMDALNQIARVVAEITLILVLFSDASHVRFKSLAKNYKTPLRMLVIALPLSILSGTIVVYLITPSHLWPVALLTAAVLAPTDATIGQAVVSGPKMPAQISHAVNVESGLNDGLVLPFVLIGAVLAGSSGKLDGDLGKVLALQIVLGPVIGAFVGWMSAKLLGAAQSRNWMELTSQGIVFVMTAFAAFLLANAAGGNGLIAAFAAGAVFGNVYRYDVSFISEFMEGQGQLLTMAAFMIFGAVLLPAGLKHIGIVTVSIAVLFLTLVRMLPVWLSLLGTGLDAKERLFLGWFGPKGLASVLFALIIVDEYQIRAEEELLACVSMTVFFSIILHGISASPLARYFSSRG